MTDDPAAMRISSGPVSFMVMKGFLGDAMVERLLAYAEASKQAFELSSVGAGRVEEETRRSLVLRDLGALKADLKARFAAVAGTVAGALKISPSNFAKYEIELVAHGDGAFYRRHIDTAVGVEHDNTTVRVLTAVYYFHRRPRAFSGGALRLHPAAVSQNKQTLDVEPEYDTALFFPSFAPHEVLAVQCPSGEFADYRFAINCWYRVTRK